MNAWATGSSGSDESPVSRKSQLHPDPPSRAAQDAIEDSATPAVETSRKTRPSLLRRYLDAPARQPETAAASAQSVRTADEREVSMRQQIRDAAATVFERKGLHQATMADIAVAAGVSRKTIYNYFDNKIGLIGAVIEADVKRLAQLTRNSLDFTLPAEELIVEAEMRLLEVAQSSKYVRLLVQNDTFDLTDEILNASERIRSIRHEYWFPILAPLRDRGQLRSRDLGEVAEWLSSFLLVMLALPMTFGGGRDRVRKVMERYLVPSVLASPPPPDHT